MQILERIYYEWLEKLQDSNEVNDAMKKICNFDDKLRQNMGKDFYDLDNAIMGYSSASQKQGFMGGFEVARQLFLGGNLK